MHFSYFRGASVKPKEIRKKKCMGAAEQTKDLQPIPSERKNGPDSSAAMTVKMKQAVQALGKVNNLRHLILTKVTEEKYDLAIEELKEYLESKPEYPAFKMKTARYGTYSVELIQAIRAKRSFPGWNTLNMAKQKDLHDKAIEHFEDLTATLKKIEVIEHEVRIEDIKSTVWVIHAFFLCLLVLLVYWFFKDVSLGLIESLAFFAERGLDRGVDFLFDKMGI